MRAPGRSRPGSEGLGAQGPHSNKRPMRWHGAADLSALKIAMKTNLCVLRARPRVSLSSGADTRVKWSELKRKKLYTEHYISHGIVTITLLTPTSPGASYNRTTATEVGARCCQSETFLRTLQSPLLQFQPLAPTHTKVTSPFEQTVISLRVTKMLSAFPR